MPLFEGTQQQYYGSQSFTASNGQNDFVLTFPNDETLMYSLSTMPLTDSDFTVTLNGNALSTSDFSYTASSFTVTLVSSASAGDIVVVTLINPDLGNYQNITLQAIINNFMVSYVGADKIIPRVRRADVAFHAQRAIQELSYDTFKSKKSQEIEVPPSLKMALPHDYVNYVKVCYIDEAGTERLLYPARKTSNPTAVVQAGDFSYSFDNNGNLLTASDSDTWARYQARNEADNSDSNDNYKKTEEDFDVLQGRRYGIEPENAQFNGIFYIDENKGYIHFSSTMSGKTVSLKYISDGLATDDEMVVHKFAEEAMYKYIAYAIASTHTTVNPSFIPMLKKERFAAIRKAKLRLSNIKIEEITQVMRGKSKQIKH